MSTREAQEPAQYWSETLQADFWVCATAAHDDAFRTEGQVAYLPDEIGLLRALKARDPASFPAKLQAIHQAKQVFGTVLDTLEPTAAPGAVPAVQGAPGACYACGTTRRWRSVYGAVVCARCHPPPVADAVAGWEGEA